MESQYRRSPILRSVGRRYLQSSYMMSMLSQVGPARMTSPYFAVGLSLAVTMGYLMDSPRVSMSPLNFPVSW